MPEDKDDKIIKELLAQGSELKAPANMGERVLGALQTEESTATAYRPVIPVWILWIVGFAFMAFLYFGITSGTVSDGTSNISFITNYLSDFISQSLGYMDMVVVSALGVMGIMFLANAYFINSSFRKLGV